MKNNKDKTTELLTAAGGGAVGGLAVSMFAKQAEKKQWKWYKPMMAGAVPMVAAYFLYDQNKAFALGMAGAGGSKVSTELGIFGMTSDDISGLFDDND